MIEGEENCTCEENEDGLIPVNVAQLSKQDSEQLERNNKKVRKHLSQMNF